MLDVPAISQETLNAIRDRITVSNEGNNDQGQQGQQGGQNQQNRVNINTASADELRSLSDRIDDGIADSIVRYRQNRQFANVDELMQVKAISIDDLKSIIDKITLSDSETEQGKININTIPLELLKILPGMDEGKANAIISRRGSDTNQTSTNGQENQGPFNNIGQLLDVQGIDENVFRQLVDIVTYRSYTFKIESKGKSLDEKVIQICNAVIDRSGDNIEIKYWNQK